VGISLIIRPARETNHHKNILVWATAMAIAAVSSVGLSTPAFAAPVAGPIIAVLGSYNFVSTSTDGTITAAYSSSTGLSV
jgi:hypothetical protein